VTSRTVAVMAESWNSPSLKKRKNASMRLAGVPSAAGLADQAHGVHLLGAGVNCGVAVAMLPGQELGA
jgi:hypothetical protein